MGVVFLVVGVLGWVENPLVGDGGIFHTDMMHNIVHLATGVLALVFGSMSAEAGKNFCKVFGLVYLAVAVVGFFMHGDAEVTSVLGLLEANQADHILHVVLALVFLGVGFCKCGGSK